MIINIDMDGVVADFDRFAFEVLGRETGWNRPTITPSEWAKLAAIPNFYQQLPVIEASKEFVQTIKKVVKQIADDTEIEIQIRFLTAIPKKTKSADGWDGMPTAEQDKRIWAEKHFPGIPVEIGPYSQDKKKWCSDGDILIDDKDSNIYDWFAAGGWGILHSGTEKKDYDETGMLLLEMIAEEYSLELTSEE